MLQHAIESCPDDHEALRSRLDELTAAGARIISVAWQPRRPDPSDQLAAFDSRGTFVIISERQEGAEGILRESAERQEIRA